MLSFSVQAQLCDARKMLSGGGDRELSSFVERLRKKGVEHVQT